MNEIIYSDDHQVAYYLADECALRVVDLESTLVVLDIRGVYEADAAREVYARHTGVPHE
jgi:hypothetical protein